MYSTKIKFPHYFFLIILLTASLFSPLLAKPVTITGNFRYMADAALITVCETGISYPVPMVKGFIDLETVYRLQQPHAGEPLFVTLKGEFEIQPSMESSNPEEKVFVVKKVISSDTTQSCSPEDIDLDNSQWILETLGDNHFSFTSEQRPISLHFTPNSSISGQDGCNGYSGSYKRTADRVAFDFSGMMSTMMYCEGLKGADVRYMESLKKVTQFSIKRGKLVFLDQQGKILMVFNSKSTVQ